MSHALHAHTPTLAVMDSRSLPVRLITCHRLASADAITLRATRHFYDPAGRQIASQDPRLAVANQRSVLSLSGQVLLTDSVDAGWQLSLFGEAGQTLQGWDGRGTERRIEYDELLRPVAVTEQEQVVERLTYGDQQTADDNQCNQLIRHDDTAGTVYRPDYGLLGSPLTEVRHFLRGLDMPDWPAAVMDRNDLLEADGLESSWAFNALGAETKQIDAVGNTRYFAHTIAGQLKSVALAEHVLFSEIRYNAFDQVEQQTLGNRVISQSTYDARDGRLIELRAGLADAPPLQWLKYEYDPVGNILQIEDAAQPVRFFANQRIEPVSRYRYDTLYQLIEAGGREVRTGSSHGPALPDQQNLPPDANQIANYTQSYEYDAGGNLQELRHVGAQSFTRLMRVAPDSNRSLPEGELDFESAFDANGNLQQLVRGQNLEWDRRNQLRQINTVQRDEGPSDSETYIYDGGGQRCRKVSSTEASGRTLIDEVRYLPGLEIRTHADGEILHVISVNNVRMLHWQAGKPNNITNDQLRYSVSDHLDSSTLELDQQGGLISQESFYPFGGTAWWAVRNAVEAKYKTVRYSGKERDASGLYYYGFRYYAPWLQRWINPDPAGDVDGLNVYRFVQNRPMNLTDHLGLRPPINEEEANQIIHHTLHGTEERLPIFLRYTTNRNPENSINDSTEHMDLADRHEALTSRINEEKWSVKLSNFSIQETENLLKNSRGGTVFRHNQIIIKSLMKGASQAVLFAHGGMSPHLKKFKTPYTVPPEKTVVFYSKHMQDTLNSIGLRLVIHESTYDADAPVGRKNFLPVEFIHGGEQSHNYSISNTLEGDLSPPNMTYDIIHVAHGDRAMLSDVFTAIETYRPEIKTIHAIFCRAVFDRNRARIYPPGSTPH